MKYRKRPFEVEAVQWFSNGHAPWWAQKHIREFGDIFVLETPNGAIVGKPGDWIVRESDEDGEPKEWVGHAKRDVFEYFYEPIKEGA